VVHHLHWTLCSSPPLNNCVRPLHCYIMPFGNSGSTKTSDGKTQSDDIVKSSEAHCNMVLKNAEESHNKALDFKKQLGSKVREPSVDPDDWTFEQEHSQGPSSQRWCTEDVFLMVFAWFQFSMLICNRKEFLRDAMTLCNANSLCIVLHDYDSDSGGWY